MIEFLFLIQLLISSFIVPLKDDNEEKRKK